MGPPQGTRRVNATSLGGFGGSLMRAEAASRERAWIRRPEGPSV